MTKEILNSDRINYLIWRYLVESDYPETAVRLQKEWNIPDPQQLPFAPHVQNHTLVSILNRGLLYNVQEREPILQNGGVAVEAPSTGFFGPLMPPSPAADEDFENARKRQIDNEQPPIHPGPPAKKPRLINGFDQGFEPTSMDVDGEQNGDENAYPSPEQAPSPVVATIGPEQGTQVEKVNELSSNTVFLELSDDPSAKNTILLHCEFNPQNPTILAAAGSDALARMWTLSPNISASGSESPGKPVLAPHTNLLHDGVPQSTTATGLTWSPDGTIIAISSEPIDDGTAKVEFRAVDGSSLGTWNVFDSPVICLRWDVSNTKCLTISPRNESKETEISVIYPAMENQLKLSLPNHSLQDQHLDAAWIDIDEFVVYGGDFLQSFYILEGAIHPRKKYETREGALLSKVTFDQHSQLLATASDLGVIEIWDIKSMEHRSFNAHQGLITSLVWQPLREAATMGDNTERLLASAGEDGAISLWNARSTDTKSKCSMTMGSAVVALAFTPDGRFIAGGTHENVFIWKTDNVHLPQATWNRPIEAGWRTPQSHDSTTEEDTFTLCWNANGDRFAYGVNSMLAVVNFKSGDEVSPDRMIS